MSENNLLTDTEMKASKISLTLNTNRLLKVSFSTTKSDEIMKLVSFRLSMVMLSKLSWLLVIGEL